MPSINDPSVPSLGIIQEGLSVEITIPTTQAQLANQGYTYNQAGLTYDQIGVQYGGVYKTDQDIIPITLSLPQYSLIPSLAIIRDGLLIDINIPATQAQLENQGYTYDQANFSYNQAGVAYGGVYNQDQDIVPIDLSFIDIYTKFVPPPLSNSIPLGPGFFLFLPQ